MVAVASSHPAAFVLADVARGNTAFLSPSVESSSSLPLHSSFAHPMMAASPPSVLVLEVTLLEAVRGAMGDSTTDAALLAASHSLRLSVLSFGEAAREGQQLG